MPEVSQETLDLYGLRSIESGGKLFCGVTEEAFAINGVTYQWPRTIKVLRWGMNFSRLGTLRDMDFKDAATRWFAEIAAACDRQFEYTSNPRLANILYTVQRLDGPRGILADMQIPVGNITPDSQMLGRFDDSENSVISETPAEGEIDIYRVGAHETLHALGMGHKPANVAATALIAPTYSRTIRNLQQADIDELIRRYGPSVTSSPPPLPPPAAKPVTVKITQDGKEWEGQIQRTR